MTPRHLLLQLVHPLLLLHLLLGLLKERESTFVFRPEVGDGFVFEFEDFVGFGDVFEALVVLLGELVQLGAFEEELRSRRVR